MALIWYTAVCDEHSDQLWSSTDSMFCLWTHMTVQLTTNKWHSYACIYLPSFLPLWLRQEAHEPGTVCFFTMKHLAKTINMQGLGEEYLRQGFHKFVNVAYLFGLFFLITCSKLRQFLGVVDRCTSPNDVKQRIEFKTMINTHTTKQELTNNSFHNTREHPKLISICIIKRNITVYQCTVAEIPTNWCLASRSPDFYQILPIYYKILKTRKKLLKIGRASCRERV